MEKNINVLEQLILLKLFPLINGLVGVFHDTNYAKDRIEADPCLGDRMTAHPAQDKCLPYVCYA